MEEKREFKIGLGIVISIFLIVVLLSGIGFFVYSNLKLQSYIENLNADFEVLKEENEQMIEELDYIKKNQMADENIVFSNSITNSNSTTPNKTQEDIYEKLLKGDFSGVEGEYINSKGEVKTLLVTGVFKTDIESIEDTEMIVDLPLKLNDGTYQWQIYDPNGGGYAGTLYPIGIPVQFYGTDGYDVNGRKFIDDTSKVRIYYGQEGPGYDETEVYYKR